MANVLFLVAIYAWKFAATLFSLISDMLARGWPGLHAVDGIYIQIGMGIYFYSYSNFLLFKGRKQVVRTLHCRT